MTDPSKLIDALKQPWQHGEHVNAQELVFDEPLHLDGLEVCGLDLSRSVLKCGLSARGTQFRGLAWFRNTRIDGNCDLTGAQFRIDFRADGLTADHVLLNNCECQGMLSFADAQLDSISLRRAVVMANLTLENSDIRKEVDLSDAELLGGLWTANARISEIKDQGSEISGRIRLPN